MIITIILIVLFVALYLVVEYLLHFWFGKAALRRRLTLRHSKKVKISLYKKRFSLSWLWRAWVNYIADLLAALRIKGDPERWLLLFCSIAAGGGFIGGLLFQDVQGVVTCIFLIGGTPYILLYMLLTQRRLSTRIEFLPAVELFYQSYLVTGERQIKIALARMIEEKRLVGSTQAVFEQLYRNLSIQEDDEYSLKIFSTALGHVWADYFAGLLAVALQEGVSITPSLKELIHDMRNARRANEQERHDLLEIRIANFSPILFLLLFIGINVKYNAESAYFYYVLDSGGREVLLNAFTMIFASFLMGLWLSRRKL